MVRALAPRSLRMSSLPVYPVPSSRADVWKAEDVREVDDLKVADGDVVVADQSEPIDANRHGRVQALVDCREDGRGARDVRAMGDLQVEVCEIGVADESEPINPDRHGRVRAHAARGIDC